MNDFFKKFSHILLYKQWKNAAKLLFAFFICFALFPLSACGKQVDYFSFVSELRDNVFLAQEGQFSLRVFSVEKEVPYEANGIAHEQNRQAEFYLIAPSSTENYTISFHLKEENQQAEMSFDNVKGEYYYFCPADLSELNELQCTITGNAQSVVLTAKSVKTQATLSPQEILNLVIENDAKLFSSLTDKHGFKGEIYLRLIYEDTPYYYVGVIDRENHVHAFLLNGETGKILAKRNT